MKRLALISILFMSFVCSIASAPRIENVVVILDRGEGSEDGAGAMTQEFVSAIQQKKASILVSKSIVKNFVDHKKKAVEFEDKFSLKLLDSDYLDQVGEELFRLNHERFLLEGELEELQQEANLVGEMEPEERKELRPLLIAKKESLLLRLDKVNVLFAEQEAILDAIEEAHAVGFSSESVVLELQKDLLFFDRWDVYEVIGGDSYLFMPPSNVLQFSKEDPLIKISNSYKLQESFIRKKKYQPLNDLKTIVKALSNRDSIEWNIYLTGHGAPIPEEVLSGEKTFDDITVFTAGIKIQEFEELLRFLAKEVNTRLLFYSTCFGGGAMAQHFADTMAQIKQEVAGKLFSIVSGNLSDASCSGQVTAEQIVQFFEKLSSVKRLNRDSILEAVSHLYSHIKTCSKSYTSSELNSFPAVLLPGTTAFQPLVVCDAVKIISAKDNIEGSVINVAPEARVLLVEPHHVIAKIVIHGPTVPAILSLHGRKSVILIDNLEVLSAGRINSLESFLRQAFGAMETQYEYSFLIKNLVCPLNSGGLYYENLKHLIDSNQKITCHNFAVNIVFHDGKAVFIPFSFLTKDPEEDSRYDYDFPVGAIIKSPSLMPKLKMEYTEFWGSTMKQYETQFIDLKK